jgi:hypothetical protein
MQFINLRKSPGKILALWILFLIPSLPILISCNDKQEQAEKKPIPSDSVTFTFFDLGNTTTLSKQVREDLSKKLGRDAIERRSILNLEINFSGYLKKYFPELEALNQKLNFPPRERVDHNTVKLMYRYAQKKNVPFDYVELVFSYYTDTPVLFKINFKVDEAGIVDTLREKYGNPEVITWNEKNGKSMFWKKNSDFLIVSLVPDQFGKHDYQIVIYYTDNLEQLIETERKEKEAKEQQRAKTGKKAF